MQKILFTLLLLVGAAILPVQTVAQEKTTTVDYDIVYSPCPYPGFEGSKVRYTATIEMQKGYLSGICILLNDAGIIKGSLFNEFGISAIDFTYDPNQRKVKLNHVIQMMNKWYIKRVLRKDLAFLMENLQNGICEYRDEKYKINYQWKVLEDTDKIEENNHATEE